MSTLVTERSYLSEIDPEIGVLISGNLGYPDLLRMRTLSKHFRNFVDDYDPMTEVRRMALTLYKELTAEIRTAYHKQDIAGMRACLERGVSPNISDKCEDVLEVQNIFSDFCVDGNDEAIKLFLEYGANINIQRKYDNDDWTPLLLACNEGNVSTVKLLIENGVDVNLADRDGITPLSAAVTAGEIEIVEMLLESGANPLALDIDGVNLEEQASRVRKYKESRGYRVTEEHIYEDILAYIQNFLLTYEK